MYRSLASHCPWGCKGSDTTEQLTQTHTYTHTKRKLKHLWKKKKKNLPKWLSHLRLAGQKESLEPGILGKCSHRHKAQLIEQRALTKNAVV